MHSTVELYPHLRQYIHLTYSLVIFAPSVRPCLVLGIPPPPGAKEQQLWASDGVSPPRMGSVPLTPPPQVIIRRPPEFSYPPSPLSCNCGQRVNWAGRREELRIRFAKKRDQKKKVLRF